MSDLKPAEKPDWKQHGIRIVRSGELDSNTPQTPGMTRAEAISHARVTSIQSGPVGHMGMTGQLYRLRISYDNAEPGAPSSLLAKFSAQNPEVRATVHSMGFYEREIGFYREFAADCPVRTPRCYFGEVEMDSGVSLLGSLIPT